MRFDNLLLFVVFGAAMGCGGTRQEQLGATTQADTSASDDIVTEHHFVTVSNGATLHVVEKFTASALQRDRRRAILMMPATLVTNLLWNADVPGTPEFNGLERGARAGFITYTLDYEGYGASSKPADGKDVTAARLAQDAGDLVRWIRHRRHVAKVDVFGSSLGSTLAVILGSAQSPIPRHWIGRVVLTANVYKSVTALATAAFFNPQVEALLEGAPNGYLATQAQTYGLVLFNADPAAQAYGFSVFPGTYAVGPTLSGFNLPVFQASGGRAPMLQFWGDLDMVTPLSDAQQFQSEYGGPHTLVVLHGGAHVPFWEPVREQFWADSFAFLDSDPGDDADEEDD
jgi:alpha-beta hydrolase superfamily lysophospholipase